MTTPESNEEMLKEAYNQGVYDCFSVLLEHIEVMQSKKTSPSNQIDHVVSLLEDALLRHNWKMFDGHLEKRDEKDS